MAKGIILCPVIQIELTHHYSSWEVRILGLKINTHLLTELPKNFMIFEIELTLKIAAGIQMNNRH